MLLEGASSGFGLGLALTNKTELRNTDMSEQELREWEEQRRQDQLKKEVGLLVNQIGKIDLPNG